MLAGAGDAEGLVVVVVVVLSVLPDPHAAVATRIAMARTASAMILIECVLADTTLPPFTDPTTMISLQHWLLSAFLSFLL